MDKYIKFRDSGLLDYKQGRNFSAKENVSMLSPHIHFGEISPHQIWFDRKNEKGLIVQLSEIGTREVKIPHMITIDKDF